MLSALQSSLHRASLTGAWRKPSLLCESPLHMPLQAHSPKLSIVCSVTGQGNCLIANYCENCDQWFCNGPAQCSESQCYDNRTSGALGWAATLDILLMMYPVPRSTFLHWMMGESFPTLIKYHRWGTTSNQSLCTSITVTALVSFRPAHASESPMMLKAPICMLLCMR